MSKILVIYKSSYGATKKYAQWIAEDLGADIFDVTETKPQMLMDYDIVVYGGGLYAGQINGVKLVAENPVKKLVVFTVGLADPAITDYSGHLASNFKPERLGDLAVFHLRGAIELQSMGFSHKAMIAIVKQLVKSKKPSNMSGEEKAIAELSGESVDFVDRDSILPIIEYVRSL